jgi:hypothetical protein
MMIVACERWMRLGFFLWSGWSPDYSKCQRYSRTRCSLIVHYITHVFPRNNPLSHISLWALVYTRFRSYHRRSLTWRIGLPTLAVTLSSLRQTNISRSPILNILMSYNSYGRCDLSSVLYCVCRSSCPIADKALCPSLVGAKHREASVSKFDWLWEIPDRIRLHCEVIDL